MDGITPRDLFAVAVFGKSNSLSIAECYERVDEMLNGMSPVGMVVDEPLDAEDMRTAIIEHYKSGKFVQYRVDPDGEWFDAQKGFLPIGDWHWDKYDYRIKPK